MSVVQANSSITSLTSNRDKLYEILSILMGVRERLTWQLEGDTTPKDSKDSKATSSSFNLPELNDLCRNLNIVALDVSELYDRFVYGKK